MAGQAPKPLIAYLRVQESFEADLLKVLARAAADTERDIRALVGRENISSLITLEQRRLVLRSIRERQAELWRQIGHTVSAKRADAAAAAVEVMQDYDEMLTRAVLSASERAILRESAVEQARRSVEHVTSRMTLSKIDLSTQVYRTRNLAAGQIDRLVDSAIARGISARDLAAEVRKFIKPDVPGGVQYAAQRLGRTELNNAFHATQIRQAVDDPFVTGMTWNLSGSHKRPDKCNDYASHGEWKPAEVPRKPHPQCLCYCTAATVSESEFITRFRRGDYDSYLSN